jgi:hypothetical protein
MAPKSNTNAGRKSAPAVSKAAAQIGQKRIGSTADETAPKRTRHSQRLTGASAQDEEPEVDESETGEVLEDDGGEEDESVAAVAKHVGVSAGPKKTGSRGGKVGVRGGRGGRGGKAGGRGGKAAAEAELSSEINTPEPTDDNTVYFLLVYILYCYQIVLLSACLPQSLMPRPKNQGILFF